LSNNQLTSIPNWIEKMQMLGALLMDNNSFSTMEKPTNVQEFSCQITKLEFDPTRSKVATINS